MEKEIIEKIRVEHYCDLCGKLVADGRSNGAGYPNYWGATIKFSRGTERDPSEYEVCLECDKSISDYILMLKKPHNKPMQESKESS